ncbi:MAG: GNAT family N-acetyltransferase [Bacteriovoracaceae bacterium]
MKPRIDSLESQRLHLEPRKESHATEIYTLLSEKDLYHYINKDAPTSVEWLANGFKKLESLTSSDQKELWLAWIGKSKESNHPVGIFEITLVGSEAFIGYTVFKDFWSKGFATEAVAAMIDYISEVYRIDRFVIEMDTRNLASVRIAEKLGFEFVGRRENVDFFKGGVS